jgi:DNA-binding MarR family transcriptional regulator
MVNNVMDEVRIYDIANNTNLKTIDKVVAILNINPYLNQVELAEYLNVTKMGICKQLKKLKKFTK